MLGRRGSRSGLAFSRSSTLTYSAVARVSRLVFTHELWTPSPHARTPPPLGITHLAGAGPDADRAELQRNLNQDQLSVAGPGQPQLLGPGQLGRVASAQGLLPEPQLTVQHAQVGAPVLAELMARLLTRVQPGDQGAGVLGQVQPVLARRPHDLEQSAGAVLDGVLALLNRTLQPLLAGQDPELDEAHPLGIRPVGFRVQRTAAGE